MSTVIKRRTPRPARSLLDRLRDEPQRFELFRTIQIIERLLARTMPAAEGAKSNTANRAIVHFSSHQSLGFPAAELHDIEGASAEPRDVRLTVNVMGLTGVLGALPQVYSELALKTQHDRNPAFTRFLDLFNDRLLNLFHRAWRRYRLPALTETHGLTGVDPARSILYALAGLGQPGLRHRQTLDDEPLIYYAGLFGQMPKSAISLERLISDFTGLPVHIAQFQTRRIPIPPDEQTRMPTCDQAGTFCQLGVDAVIGEAAIDAQGCFRVVLGPLTYQNFLAYLPGGPAVVRLNDLVRIYVGPEFSYEFQLVLRSDQIPACILAGDPTRAASRLGWNSWATSMPPLRDAADAVFDAEETTTDRTLAMGADGLD